MLRGTRVDRHRLRIALPLLRSLKLSLPLNFTPPPLPDPPLLLLSKKRRDGPLMSAPLISPRHPCSSSFLSAIILPLPGSCLKFGRAASVRSVPSPPPSIAPNRVSGLFHPRARCPALHEAGSSPGKEPSRHRKVEPEPRSCHLLLPLARQLIKASVLFQSAESSSDSVTANFCNCSIEAKIA